MSQGNHGLEVEEKLRNPEDVSSIPPCALFLFSQEKSPEISGDYGKLRNLRKQIPRSFRAIIFPSPDR
jgi:hypothetical protein